MASKLKRDQLPFVKAANWLKSLEEEEKLTFNLKVPQIILQKETYKVLAGENENRVRVYLGLEPIGKEGKLKLCAYAVSAFLLGSGDVYVDYETPVYKLEKKNIDCSANINDVLESIRRYRDWRAGEIAPDVEGAEVRKYIYPNAYLLTKFELHEIFNVQNKEQTLITFGISKRMEVMLFPEEVDSETKQVAAIQASTQESEVYNDGMPCPPYCDDGSPYNT